MGAVPFSRVLACTALIQFISLPVIGDWLGHGWGAPLAGNLLTPFWVFAVFPLLDTWMGRDERNPASTRINAGDAGYRVLPLLALPAYAALLAWSAPRFAGLAQYDLAAAIALAVSVGILGGAVGITCAHELIHKPTTIEHAAGGILLSLVAYGGFKVEHVFGHHVDVATPRDTSTARLGQSAYAFLARSFAVNPLRAWQLAGARLRAKGLPPWHWRNEMYLWHGLTLCFAVLFAVWLGWHGAAFFVLQAFVAITLLELVNYIEHYGLLRQQRPDGSFERVTHRHSWNDSHRLSNHVLLNLQRHSDHHAHAARRYPFLLHHDDAPQLPTGYASLVLLALIPPLWRQIMDPRVLAWRAEEAGLTPSRS